MANTIWDELRGLFGKAIDSSEVTDFLAKYPGHKISKPSDGRQSVMAKKDGFELLFGLPDGAHSGGKTAKLRVLITAFLNSAAVPKNKPFAGLPTGLSFDADHATLVEALGPPISTRTTDAGVTYSARWAVDGFLLDAAYVLGSTGVKSFTLMSPAVVPG
jgi:hypothetical protein